MKRNIVANGNMTSEENTIHKKNGKRCGDILSKEPSRLEKSFGHRIYECNGCSSKWKFGLCL